MSNKKAAKAQLSFGRILYYKGDGYERTSIEAAETISLAPGQSYSFNEDVGKRWPELFAPGINQMTIIDRSDDDQTVTANTLELSMMFTVDSFSALLAMLTDDNYSIDAKLFAAKWITRFCHRFNVQLNEPTQAERLMNEKMIQETAHWWQSNRGTAEVLKTIANINLGL